MSDRRRFDWLAFLTRIIVIAALATLLLIERLHRHDRRGAVLVVIIGYGILPAVAYLQTRYYNLALMFGIPEALRRKFGGHKHGGET